MKYTDLCAWLERFAEGCDPDSVREAAAAIRELEAEVKAAPNVANLWQDFRQQYEDRIHAEKTRAEAAEARVAELTRERDGLLTTWAESRERHLDAEAKVARLQGALGSVAEQAMFEEWQAEMGSDPNDQGDVSMDWHAGYDAAIRHARNELAALRALGGAE